MCDYQAVLSDRREMTFVASKTVRVLVVPAGVILSTMFGGGYASGREVATFVSSHGPWGGVLAIVVMALVFGLILVLCIEIARVFGTYEYASFRRVLLARAAMPLFTVGVWRLRTSP